MKLNNKGNFFIFFKSIQNLCVLNFFFENIKISIFGGISKFFKLIVFGELLAKFGNCGQFWAILGIDLSRFHYIGSSLEHTQSKAKILKTL
jgi:hypothetical protein